MDPAHPFIPLTQNTSTMGQIFHGAEIVNQGRVAAVTVAAGVLVYAFWELRVRANARLGKNPKSTSRVRWWDRVWGGAWVPCDKGKAERVFPGQQCMINSQGCGLSLVVLGHRATEEPALVALDTPIPPARCLGLPSGHSCLQSFCYCSVWLCCHDCASRRLLLCCCRSGRRRRCHPHLLLRCDVRQGGMSDQAVQVLQQAMCCCHPPALPLQCEDEPLLPQHSPLQVPHPRVTFSSDRGLLRTLKGQQECNRDRAPAGFSCTSVHDIRKDSRGLSRLH